MCRSATLVYTRQVKQALRHAYNLRRNFLLRTSLARQLPAYDIARHAYEVYMVPAIKDDSGIQTGSVSYKLRVDILHFDILHFR